MYSVKKMHTQCSMVLLSCVMSFSAIADESDPWERFNRSMHKFNSALDKAILKPIAQGYDGIVPAPVKKGTSNFFDNLGELDNTVNNLLQGKLIDSAASTTRFVINSTVGVLGLFDVATAIGLDEQPEDFGQTFGYWGIGAGPYLVIPFFGPSSVRDGTGTAIEFAVTDYEYELINFNWEEEFVLDTLNIVQSRAKLLPVEGLIIGDEYSFIRDVYLQSRVNEIYDGNPPETDDGWGDDDGGWGDDDWEEDDSWGDDDNWEDETTVTE